MRQVLKRVFAWLVVPLLRVVAPVFFEKQYLPHRRGANRPQEWFGVWRAIWFQKILGFNRHVPWPMNPFSRISNPQNLVFHAEDMQLFVSPGCYFQNFAGKIHLGKGTFIAPNVGIITANHDPMNLDTHLPGLDVRIGDQCWIGMNSVVLPGVTLGDRTIVGAGSVVTRSFPDGYCVIAGSPARLIKRLCPAEQ